VSVPRWAFAGLGYALLLVAWAFAGPPGAAPDEAAHAVRAAAAGQGQWEGRPAQPFQRSTATTPAQADYLNAQSQAFDVPARLVPPPPCFAGHPDAPAACAAGADRAGTSTGTVTATTYATTAPPPLYTLAGLAMRVPQAVLPPVVAGRLVLALVCALLLAGATWSAGLRGSLWPAIGVALAATPTALFLGASLNPAGVTACAAICFAAAVFGLWSAPRRGALAIAALSGAALALSRPSGLVVLAIVGAAAVPLVWPRSLLRAGLALSVTVVLAAALAETAWALAHQPSPPLGGLPVEDALPQVWSRWADVGPQLVGAFGPLGEVRLPAALPAAWEVLAALVVGAAVVVGFWRDRLAMALVAAAAVAVAAAAYALVLAPLGWDLQGRFLLAPAAVLPLLAGFVLHRAGLRSRRDALLIGLVVGAVQLAAFWENARRYAVGRHGPIGLVDTAAWAPAGGWTLWLGVAAAGSALLALALVPLTAAERASEWEGHVTIDPAMVSISR
jgi:hypothetical protein